MACCQFHKRGRDTHYALDVHGRQCPGRRRSLPRAGNNCVVFDLFGLMDIPLQVPLILAWALSIHKSQGQTLERVKVDLARIFEKGQGERPAEISGWSVY